MNELETKSPADWAIETLDEITNKLDALEPERQFRIHARLEKLVKKTKENIKKEYLALQEKRESTSDHIDLEETREGIKKLTDKYPFLKLKEGVYQHPLTEGQKKHILNALINTKKYTKEELMTPRRVIEPELLSEAELKKSIAQTDYNAIVEPEIKAEIKGVTIYNQAK